MTSRQDTIPTRGVDRDMRILVYLSLAALGCAFASPAHAADQGPVILEPSSPWELEYADDKCRLSRKFGEGENSTELQLEQSGPEPYFALLLVGNRARAYRANTMTIQFGPNEGITERGFLFGTFRESKMPFVVMYGIHLGVARNDLRPGDDAVVDIGPQRESAISDVTFGKGLRQPLKLALGSMGEPMSLMRDCTADLMRHIGLDTEGQSKLARAPIPTNWRVMARFIQERYPQKMLEQGLEGTVEVRLTVNPAGEATACQIKKSDRPASFDDSVCFGLVKIARFEPALGTDGKPRYGFYNTRVSYEIH